MLLGREATQTAISISTTINTITAIATNHNTNTHQISSTPTRGGEATNTPTHISARLRMKVLIGIVGEGCILEAT